MLTFAIIRYLKVKVGHVYSSSGQIQFIPGTIKVLELTNKLLNLFLSSKATSVIVSYLYKPEFIMRSCNSQEVTR